MAITVHLPQDIEQQLRAHFPDIERRVAEGYAVEAYRRGDLSSRQVGQMLGFSDRAQTERFLSERRAFPNYDAEDFAQDIQTLETLPLLQGSSLDSSAQ